MTSERPRRRPTLLDAVALVAATAAGVGMIRACWGPGVPEPIATLGAPLAMPKVIQPWSPWIVPQRANGLAMLVVTLLIAWTPALIILRLRRPRLGLRRLMIRPGSAAVALAAIALAWEGIQSVLREVPLQATGLRKSWSDAFSQEPAGYIPWALFLENAVLSVGAALVAYGPVVVATRSGPRDRDWIDRACLGLGLLWVAACVIHRLSLVGSNIVGYLR